jgi:hypothetical protein
MNVHSALFGGDVMTAEAKARFKEGLDFYKAHKNVEARAKYLQALALSQAAAIYLNLAVVEYDLLMYPDALRHAKAYVVHPKAEPAKVEKLKKEMIPDLESKTAHLAVEGQPGQAVFVDGEKVGVAPIADQVHVAPGEHTVACGTITKTVTVKAGDTATVIVVVPSVTPPPASASAVAPPPSATPSASSAPPPSASSAAPMPSASANPPPTETTTTWTPTRGVITGGLGAVGVAGIVVGVLGMSSKSSADDRISKDNAAIGSASCSGAGAPSQCSDLASAFHDRSSATNQMTAGFVIGGVGLGAALATLGAWYMWPATVQVTGSASPHGGGMSLIGSF